MMPPSVGPTGGQGPPGGPLPHSDAVLDLQAQRERARPRIVAIADQNPVFALGIAVALGLDAGQVLSTRTLDGLGDLLGKSPDVLLLDARFLATSSELCRQAARQHVPVVLTMPRHEADTLADLVTDGVVGVWDRDGEAVDLRRIVTSAMGGESLTSPEMGGALLGRLAGDPALSTIGQLTRRESEILGLMSDGSGNRAIAETLFISENTVRNHVRNVLDKMHARTRTEAVVRALRAGLVRLR